MSVGHIARALEAVGIATVCVYIEAFRQRAVALQVPRALVTRFPMGRPLGAPGNAAQHLRILRAALRLLDHAGETSTLVDFPEAWEPVGALPEA
ncbi:MAG TPA: hypothetical protein VMV29_03000 [Ktedonobacterales bacterium]|nr:hypothetical protein [Ktedonobacterales bacterium]